MTGLWRRGAARNWWEKNFHEFMEAEGNREANVMPLVPMYGGRCRSKISCGHYKGTGAVGGGGDESRRSL